jgi:hypothetical protein
MQLSCQQCSMHSQQPEHSIVRCTCLQHAPVCLLLLALQLLLALLLLLLPLPQGLLLLGCVEQLAAQPVNGPQGAVDKLNHPPWCGTTHRQQHTLDKRPDRQRCCCSSGNAQHHGRCCGCCCRVPRPQRKHLPQVRQSSGQMGAVDH